MRRSRSPGWKGRILANSVPLPCLGERFTPTRPGVRTGGAEASNREVCGRATRVRAFDSPCLGAHRKPAHALEATTSAGPTRRDPQRVGRITIASASSPSSRRLTTICPSTGCRSIHIVSSSTAATSSTRPSGSRTSMCQVVASPSRISPWPIEWRTSGKHCGREDDGPHCGTHQWSSEDQQVRTAGQHGTAVSARPPSNARACAVVGCQESCGFTTKLSRPASESGPKPAPRRSQWCRRPS